MDDLTSKKFGPYQIVAPVGEGGMAAVYKAYQPSMERFFALKVLPRTFAEDPQSVTRFKREAVLLAQLQHPHIPSAFDFGIRKARPTMGKAAVGISPDAIICVDDIQVWELTEAGPIKQILPDILKETKKIQIHFVNPGICFAGQRTYSQRR